MWQALSITLGEGFSAFLVVAVMLAFFTRAGRHRFRRATRWGIGLSLPATVGATALFSVADDQALWEGVLALAAAAAVAWVAWHMWHTSRLAAHAPPRALTAPAIAAITVLLITRGSMEIGLLLATLVMQVPALSVIAGAALGPVLAVACGMLWAHTGHRVAPRVFAQVTALFLPTLLLQLLIDGVHEIAEAGAFAAAEHVHRATEPVSSEGVYGQLAQYLLLAAPLAWWVVTIFWVHGKASGGSVPHLGR